MQNKCVQYALTEFKNEIGVSIANNEDVDISYYKSALNNDVARIEAAIRGLFGIFDGFINALFAIMALIYIHWTVMLFSIFLFVCTLVIPKLLKKYSVNNEKSLSSIQNNFLHSSSDCLDGYFVWDAYNAKNAMRTKLANLSNSYEKKRFHLNNIRDILTLFPYYINAIGQFALMAFDVAMTFLGFVKPETVLTVGQLAGTLFNNITSMLSSFTLYSGYEAVYNDITKTTNHKTIPEAKLSDLNLKITNLNFSYNKENNIIQNFSQSFKSGKKYLILGPSGSGKSTLLNIIFKNLRNYTGDISIGNQDYTAINKEQLHNIIGYITQQSYVFDDSIANNIELGSSFSATELSTAIKSAKLDELSNQLDSNAKNLSGGQIQRVCLARELVRAHSIILLDEIANAVDETTAKEIYEVFLKSDRTVIAVAHYLPEGIKDEFDEIIKMG